MHTVKWSILLVLNVLKRLYLGCFGGDFDKFYRHCETMDVQATVVPNWEIVILRPNLRKEWKTALCDFGNK